MAMEPLISWDAPQHLHTEKGNDWYWIVGIITLALAVVAFLFGEIITGIFIIVAAATLIIHVSRPPHISHYEINDRGIAADEHLYPFLTLDSFCIPHDVEPPRIILKSRKFFMPFIVIYLFDVDPEEVRATLLKYIAETEHREPFMKLLLERLGF